MNAGIKPLPLCDASGPFMRIDDSVQIFETPQDVNYNDFDISGSTAEARYPWQRDVCLQCNLLGIPLVPQIKIPVPVHPLPRVTVEQHSTPTESPTQGTPVILSSDEQLSIGDITFPTVNSGPTAAPQTAVAVANPLSASNVSVQTTVGLEHELELSRSTSPVRPDIRRHSHRDVITPTDHQNLQFTLQFPRRNEPRETNNGAFSLFRRPVRSVAGSTELTRQPSDAVASSASLSARSHGSTFDFGSSFGSLFSRSRRNIIDELESSSDGTSGRFSKSRMNPVEALIECTNKGIIGIGSPSAIRNMHAERKFEQRSLAGPSRDRTKSRSHGRPVKSFSNDQPSMGQEDDLQFTTMLGDPYPSLRARDVQYFQAEPDETERLLEEHFRNDGEITLTNLRSRDDILPSPSVSPLPWQRSRDSRIASDTSASAPKFLDVPKKKGSKGTISSISDESAGSEGELSPPSTRRGRRAAIVENRKNMGESSSEEELNLISEDDSSSYGTNPEGAHRWRKSSIDMPSTIKIQKRVEAKQGKALVKRKTLPTFPINSSGNDHRDSGNVGCFMGYHCPIGSPDINSEKKAQRFSFLKLIDKKSRSRVQDEDDIRIRDQLLTLQRSKYHENPLIRYKDMHWSQLLDYEERIPEIERKRREAVWELFTSECFFLVDHLFVIKHCFMEPLKKLQVEGLLMFAEPQILFGNLDEVCYVSYTFCKELISALLKSVSTKKFGNTALLVRIFKRYARHSRGGEVYHEYCLNYNYALNHLEQLRKNDDFTEFEKWCEVDLRCKRLQLTDLLVAPIQHATKLPLLLANISKYTKDPEERNATILSLENVQTSLNNLEDKMKWLKNFERVQELQQRLRWPSIFEVDSKVLVPDFLKMNLSKQPCERLLASPKRMLIHEGPLQIVEQPKTADGYLFLFDDTLLVTKVKKIRRSRQFSSESLQPGNSRATAAETQNTMYVVHGQPIALDRFSVHDIQQQVASTCGLRHAFVLVQISRFQQIIAVYTFQAPDQNTKKMWLSRLKEARKKYKEAELSAEKKGAHELEMRSRRAIWARRQSQKLPRSASPRRFSDMTNERVDSLDRPPSPRRHSAMPHLSSPVFDEHGNKQPRKRGSCQGRSKQRSASRVSDGYRRFSEELNSKRRDSKDDEELLSKGVRRHSAQPYLLLGNLELMIKSRPTSPRPSGKKPMNFKPVSSSCPHREREARRNSMSTEKANSKYDSVRRHSAELGSPGIIIRSDSLRRRFSTNTLNEDDKFENKSESQIRTAISANSMLQLPRHDEQYVIPKSLLNRNRSFDPRRDSEVQLVQLSKSVEDHSSTGLHGFPRIIGVDFSAKTPRNSLANVLDGRPKQRHIEIDLAPTMPSPEEAPSQISSATARTCTSAHKISLDSNPHIQQVRRSSSNVDDAELQLFETLCERFNTETQFEMESPPYEFGEGEV